MSSDLNTLLEMGFSKNKAERALSVTQNQGVEAAMEWLLAHNDELDEAEIIPEVETHMSPAISDTSTVSMDVSQESLTEPTLEKSESEEKMESAPIGDNSIETSPTAKQEEEEEGAAKQAKSLKCDECGKIFRSPPEVEFHAVKSGHQSFSESTEEVKPLTEEEKKEQLRKVEEKIRQRRAEREEQARKEAIEREKQRRRLGQDLSQARQRLAEEEMRRAAEQRRREKLEEKLAKQKILEEIERDKQARKKMFGMAPETPEPKAAAAAPSPAASPSQSAAKKNYDECKLQIRLTNGQLLTQTFGANEELAAVRLYVQLNRTDGSEPFSLMTNFPRRVFSDDDMSKPLNALGLIPSAVLIVTKSQ